MENPQQQNNKKMEFICQDEEKTNIFVLYIYRPKDHFKLSKHEPSSMIELTATNVLGYVGEKDAE